MMGRVLPFAGRTHARVAWLVAACLLMAVLAAVRTRAEDTAASDEDGEREARLGEMRSRAESTDVVVRRGGERIAAETVEEPLFRFSDQPRNIQDATLWAWTSGGRPVAVQKVELYRFPNQEPSWLYCLASLADTPIDVQWGSGEAWSSTQPGIVMRPLPDPPAPRKAPGLRRTQLRKIAERFSVDIADPAAGTREHMRLLTTPLHRFSDPDAGIVDGALFGFASNGTNPDALLLIELVDGSADSPQWQYGFVQMTTGELSASLEKQIVWTAPFRKVGGPSRFESWLFFREAPESTQ